MGKVVVILLLLAAALGGAGIWWTQTRAFWAPYDGPVTLTLADGRGGLSAIPAEAVEAARSTSSPLGFRACFRHGLDLAALAPAAGPAGPAAPAEAPADAAPAGSPDAAAAPAPAETPAEAAAVLPVVPVDRPAPTVAPGWFDCFDADAVAAALAAGEAQAFLAYEDAAFGVDRHVALHADGRGWAWHVLNECGRRRYDGTEVGRACPDRDTFRPLTEGAL